MNNTSNRVNKEKQNTTNTSKTKQNVQTHNNQNTKQNRECAYKGFVSVKWPNIGR